MNILLWKNIFHRNISQRVYNIAVGLLYNIHTHTSDGLSEYLYNVIAM